MRTHDIVDRPRAQIKYNAGGTLQLKAYDAGTQIIPTSATITVKRPGGAACTTPVSGATVTIDGSGNMSYALSAGNADFLVPQFGAYAPWTAEWSYVYSGVTTVFIQLFDVCLYTISSVVTQADLVRYHPDLSDSFYSTESNSATYIVQAWEDVYRHFLATDKRPYLVLDAEEFRRPTEMRALHLYFHARLKGDTDRWATLADYYHKEYESWWTGQKWTIDEDQTGTIVPGESQRAQTQIAVRV